MAFRHENFNRVGFNHSNSPACFSYSTTDTLSIVSTSDYFNDPRADIVLGDFILVHASDGEDVFIARGTTSAEPKANTLTGWSTYVDTQYPNSGSAFTVSADTDTVLPNNRGTVIETQKPIDVDTFYDGSVITGRNGDNLDVMIYFRAVPSAANQWMDVWIDIGGAVGELYRQTFSFPKGASVERGVLYALPSAYTLNTWEANGGTVYVRTNASLDVYRINFNFDRSHKAR